MAEPLKGGFSSFQTISNPFKPNQNNSSTDTGSKPGTSSNALFGNASAATAGGGFSLSSNTGGNTNTGASIFGNQSKSLFESVKPIEKTTSQDGANSQSNVSNCKCVQFTHHCFHLR